MLTLITLPVLILDQLSKYLVSHHFQLYHSVPIVPGWLDLTYTLNPGAAFSLFANMPAGFRSWFFVGLSCVAIIVLVTLLARSSTPRSSAIAYALILGGALGNLIDRVLHSRVTDFIYFHHEAFSYPVFNLADSAITVGVAIAIILSFVAETEPDQAIHR